MIQMKLKKCYTTIPALTLFCMEQLEKLLLVSLQNSKNRPGSTIWELIRSQIFKLKFLANKSALSCFSSILYGKAMDKDVYNLVMDCRENVASMM